MSFANRLREANADGELGTPITTRELIRIARFAEDEFLTFKQATRSELVARVDEYDESLVETLINKYFDIFLTTDSKQSDVTAALRPQRASQTRRKELERIANLCVPRHIDIHMRFVTSGAACRPRDREDAYEIHIPT